MRDLAKTFGARILTLQVIFVAIIVVAIAGLSRQSTLLEWSALVATILLVVADPLTIRNKVGATPTTEVVEDPAIERKIFNPNKTGQTTPVSSNLIASKV
jgi:hypothetical protein